ADPGASLCSLAAGSGGAGARARPRGVDNSLVGELRLPYERLTVFIEFVPRTLSSARHNLDLGAPALALPSCQAPVAQWIEQRFPKPRALVRFRPGASRDPRSARASTFSVLLERRVF